MFHTNCRDRTETISSLVKVNLGHPFLTLAYSRGISFHFGVKLHRTMAILIEDPYFFPISPKIPVLISVYKMKADSSV